ncbi:hypothetical protein [Streptomyces sp. NPDC000133]
MRAKIIALASTWEVVETGHPNPVPESDVFPMTSHVECVAILEPAQKSL